MSEVIRRSPAAQPVYSTGTFVPIVEGSTSAGSGSYSTQVGRYTRVGRLVFIEITLTYTGHTGTGNLYVTGLPFLSAAVSENTPPLSLMVGSLTFSNQLVARVNSNTKTITMWQCATDAAPTALAIDAAATIRLSGFYEAA